MPRLVIDLSGKRAKTGFKRESNKESTSNSTKSTPAAGVSPRPIGEGVRNGGPMNGKPMPRPRIGKLPPSPLANCFRHIRNPDTDEAEWRYYLIWVEAAAGEGDTKMQKLLDHYLTLPPREQATVMPEQLCDLAGVMPHELFAAVTGQLFKYSRQETLLIAAIEQPRVVESVARRARADEGSADAQLFLRGTGFLPQPKGTTLYLNSAHAPEAREPVMIGAGSANRLGSPQAFVPAARRVLDLEALDGEESESVGDNDGIDHEDNAGDGFDNDEEE